MDEFIGNAWLIAAILLAINFKKVERLLMRIVFKKRN